MKREIKDHKDKDRRIAYYIDGEIPTDDDGPRIYIVEGVYEMTMEDEDLVYNVFLTRREGTKSHGQIEWEITSHGDENHTFYKILVDLIEKNHKNYQWL